MKKCCRCKIDKSTDDFHPKRSSGGIMSICKKCNVQKNKEWRDSKPDYGKDRYQKIKTKERERHLIKKYGVTLKDYDAMLISQGGECAICNKPESEEKHGVLHVDHCHKTGVVRGLLCNNCNQVLGRAMDNPETLCRAAEYLVPQIPELIGRAIMEAER
jgi:hypothetical protein